MVNAIESQIDSAANPAGFNAPAASQDSPSDGSNGFELRKMLTDEEYAQLESLVDQVRIVNYGFLQNVVYRLSAVCDTSLPSHAGGNGIRRGHVTASPHRRAV